MAEHDGLRRVRRGRDRRGARKSSAIPSARNISACAEFRFRRGASRRRACASNSRRHSKSARRQRGSGRRNGRAGFRRRRGAAFEFAFDQPRRLPQQHPALLERARRSLGPEARARQIWRDAHHSGAERNHRQRDRRHRQRDGLRGPDDGHAAGRHAARFRPLWRPFQCERPVGPRRQSQHRDLADLADRERHRSAALRAPVGALVSAEILR